MQKLHLGLDYQHHQCFHLLHRLHHHHIFFQNYPHLHLNLFHRSNFLFSKHKHSDLLSYHLKFD